MKYYEANSKLYIEKTISVDMSFHYDKFLKFIPKNSHILDVGFGSGRDMIFFSKNGYNVSGIDTSMSFVDNMLKHGYDVRLLDVLELNEPNKYDGIWASASLLHVDDLLKAFNNLYNSLKPNGVLFASFKYGDFKGIRDERFYVDLNEESAKELINKTKFKIEEIYITDDLMQRSNLWLNIIVKKD